MEPATKIASPCVLVIPLGTEPTPGLLSVLGQEDFLTWSARSKHDLPTLLKLRPWDLVVLDLKQPGPTGLRRCHELRQHFSGPMVALARQATDLDLVRVLDTGVDEALSWPTQPTLFGARLKALLRRAPRNHPAPVLPEPPLQVGSLQIDPARREATYNTRTVSLTQQELSLLRLFAIRAGRPVSRDEISDCLRGIPHDFGDRSIDLQISRLRKKLGDDCRNPRLILTVRGIGYQLVAQSLDDFH